MSEIIHTYLNTLIFTIVAKVLTLIILMVLYFYKPMRDFLITIVIVEVGLLMVILFSLWNVISADRAAVKRSNAFNQSAAQLADCPHYFVSEMSTDNTTNALKKDCKNTYAPPGDPNTPIRFGSPNADATYGSDLGIYQIDQSKTFDTVCSNANNQRYPLTDLKTLCTYST